MSDQKVKPKLKLGQLIGLVYDAFGSRYAPLILSVMFKKGWARRAD